MPQFHPAWVEHRRKQWTRPDARRWIRPDAKRYLKPQPFDRKAWLDQQRLGNSDDAASRPCDTSPDQLVADWRDDPEVKRLVAEIKLDILRWQDRRKYSPEQPRVPAGNPDGGQWTDSGGDTGLNDPRAISDASPEDEVTPGAQYAQNRPRSSMRVSIGGRIFEVEGGQATRLFEAQTRAESAIGRVRELDPNWRPAPSAYESVEGLIRAHVADAQEAQARASELARVGIGPGPFAGESIPARGPERNFTAQERREINRIGAETGCHTCGTFDSGTRTGNFVPDHQLPNALNSLGRPQRLYPQCLSCSDFQGGWIRGNRGGR